MVRTQTRYTVFFFNENGLRISFEIPIEIPKRYYIHTLYKHIVYSLNVLKCHLYKKYFILYYMNSEMVNAVSLNQFKHFKDTHETVNVLYDYK